ncbi:MAG: DUF4129 domain-containing protein [Desulfobacterales bacterium]
MKTNSKKHYKSAIRIIEEAVHLLRSSPGRLLAGYYTGSVPFVLGLMYFWADMSRSANAGEHCTLAALILAFLYIWMKFWHAVFAHQVRVQMTGEPPSNWSWQRIVSVAASQSLIQATRFIVLPIAGVLMIPYGYCYAFYQNATAYVGEDPQNITISSTCKWAWRQSRLWPRQNHLVICIFWIFGVVIFLNISVTAFILPQMVKTLFGIDSIFTLSGMRMILNTTFWIAMLGTTYLCLDPLIKTVYVLRCFYGSALKSGDDLKKGINHALVHGKIMAMGMMVVVLCAFPLTCLGGQSLSVSPEELDRSIEETLGRREFAWRMPRETVHAEEEEVKGPLEAAIKWLLDGLAKGIRIIEQWISQFFEWLENLMPKGNKKTASSNKNWITSVRAVLIFLILVFLAILIFFILRIWRRQQTGSIAAVAAGVPQPPDLNDESTKADDLPANRWLVLAEELTSKGELRLAMRALYLATLAYLAERQMITIEIYKSNREYEQELRRRAHERKELLTIFAKSLNLFERVWYGMYRIPRSEFNDYAANQKRILTFDNDATVHGFSGSMDQGSRLLGAKA